MESLKEPKSLLTVANLVGLIATSAYFYKQNEMLKEELMRVSQLTDSLSKRMDKVEEHKTAQTEMVKKLHLNVKDMQREINYVDVEGIEDQINTIIHTLEQSQIPLETGGLQNRKIPSKHPLPSRSAKSADYRKRGSRREEMPKKRDTHTLVPDYEFGDEDYGDAEDLVAQVRKNYE